MEHVPNVCIDWNTNGTFGRIFIQKKGSNKGLSVTIPLRCEHERSGLLFHISSFLPNAVWTKLKEPDAKRFPLYFPAERPRHSQLPKLFFSEFLLIFSFDALVPRSISFTHNLFWVAMKCLSNLWKKHVYLKRHKPLAHVVLFVNQSCKIVWARPSFPPCSWSL